MIPAGPGRQTPRPPWRRLLPASCPAARQGASCTVRGRRGCPVRRASRCCRTGRRPPSISSTASRWLRAVCTSSSRRAFCTAVASCSPIASRVVSRSISAVTLPLAPARLPSSSSPSTGGSPACRLANRIAPAAPARRGKITSRWMPSSRYCCSAATSSSVSVATSTATGRPFASAWVMKGWSGLFASPMSPPGADWPAASGGALVSPA